VIRCSELDLSREGILEVFNVGLVVGESIVNPYSERGGTPLDEIVENEE